MTGDKASLIAIVVPDIINPYFAEIARGCSEAAGQKNFNTLLFETLGEIQREESVLATLLELPIRGLILCDSCLSDNRLRFLENHNFPLVLFDRRLLTEKSEMIRIDHQNGMRQVVNHLASNGRKNIAFLSAMQESYSAKEAMYGYEIALKEAGLSLLPDFCVPCKPTWEDGYLTAREFLVTHLSVDGIICHNDLVAGGALNACLGLGKRVPGDIAIVGCNDIWLARIIKPALTTLHIPKYEAGAMAFRQLYEVICGRSQPKEVVISQRLVIRASAPA